MRTTYSGVDQSPGGWITFASIVLTIVGCFHAMAGLVALFKPSLYLTTANHLFVFNYTQWGWVHLLYGLLLVGASFALYAGRMWARVLTIVLAVVSMVLNFAFIWAYPIWSIMIIALDLFVIYNVAMYGGREEE